MGCLSCAASTILTVLIFAKWSCSLEMEQIQQQCIENSGSDSGYRNIIKASNDAENCISQYVLIQDLDSGSLQIDCKQIHEMDRQCFDSIHQGFVECQLNGQDSAEMESVTVVLGAIQRFCTRASHSDEDFQRKTYEMCIQRLLSKIDACSKTPTHPSKKQARSLERVINHLKLRDLNF
ncbi:uncharacterized protein LOC129744149 [Uranotaenia lowii]|uniref:uncharacterized protein LOC129744149 n=1 Tax=Uranotaenia lowii TaxID=190385 RepID=UPI00247A76EB|nr:uncharacterized protein LOC129744149 [Uranotaenia lowii]